MNHYDSGYARNLDRDEDDHYRLRSPRMTRREKNTIRRIKEIKQALFEIEDQIRTLAKEVETSFPNTAVDLGFSIDRLIEVGDTLETRAVAPLG